MRWLYPKKKYINYIEKKIKDLLQPHAYITNLSGLQKLGLLKNNLSFSKKVGPLIAVALDNFFPAPELNYKYNHGSFTYEEMFVPLALWNV